MDYNSPEDNRDEMELVPSESRELSYDKAYTCTNCGSVFNKDKVFCPSCGLSIQELQQPARQDGYTAEIGVQPGTGRSARIFALLSLILGIAGPLALGVGWLLAIIFGFTALNLIRAVGGFRRERKFAVWGISLGFFWPVAFFIIFSLYSYSIASERAIARNEADVQNVLIDAAVAQKFIKSGHFLEDEGKNLYAKPEEMLEIDHRLVPDSFDGHVSGYYIQMRVKPDEGFEVIAHPDRYGKTGRKSFYIDESGILRGDDIKADMSFYRWTALPRQRDNPIYDDYDNLIVENLISLARRLAREERDFERAAAILSEIRTEYYMIPAAAGVDEARESLERHVYEENARRRYREALSILDEDRLRDALSKLKHVKSSFEDAAIIPDVKSRITEVESSISSLLEDEAKELFEKAGELEKKGEYDGAIEKYKKIVSELDSTSYYERASNLIEAVESRKREKRAEDLFTEIASLNIEESYSEAISAANSLLDRYSETEFVQKNIRRLRGILDAAAGEREKHNAIRAFQQGNFNAAIQAGESAVESNPALREIITPIIRHSYLKRAESLFANQAYEEAVPYYESWMKLADYNNTPEYANYLSSRFNAAKNKFEAGDYQEAKEGLEGIERHFRRDAEFWYMLGSIHALEKDYSAAVPMLGRSLSIDENNPDAWYKKALCRMVFLQREEDELKELMDRLFGLKRGVHLFNDINSLANGLNAKDLEIKHLAAGSGGGEAGERRRARLLAERDSFESETRMKIFDLAETIEANNQLRSEVISAATGIYDMYNEINSDIMRIPSGRRDRRRRSLIAQFRRKRADFEGYFKLERGLNQELRLEENAMLNLEFALNKFSQERSFESELREMSRLRESITHMGMQRSVDEGREGVMSAVSRKISVEEHISQIM